MICFLIDDDHDDQEIFELALKDVDPSYECITAGDCFDALTILKADEQMHIDFIFMDINMPKMTGKECVIELKKTPATRAHSNIFIFDTRFGERDGRCENFRRYRFHH